MGSAGTEEAVDPLVVAVDPLVEAVDPVVVAVPLCVLL